MTSRFAEPLTINGSSTELREVVINLIMNALDAMPRGGEMRFDGEVINDQVVLTISDTGTGMDEEILKRIFDPFFSTKRGEGTGLGLSVAYGIILRHNGRIECSSEVGKGTVFRIQMPYQSQPEASAPALLSGGDETGKRPFRPLNVLIVDDEAPIREIFHDVLTQEGHTVYMAESGEAALALLRKEHVDLLFTDLSMPGMSGWEVAKQARKEFPKMVLVVTSGWGKDFNQKQLAQYGVNYVLPKPVQFETLQTLARQVAEGRAIRLPG